jgi:hypothetical protein
MRRSNAPKRAPSRSSIFYIFLPSAAEPQNDPPTSLHCEQDPRNQKEARQKSACTDTITVPLQIETQFMPFLQNAVTEELKKTELARATVRALVSDAHAE